MRRFLVLLALYLVPHTIIRLLLSRSLEFDEAEQLLFAQTLALGYSPQPPLYTWLLWPMVRLFGANVLSLTLFKMGLLACIYTLLYLLAARLLKDARLACLAAFTPLIVPVFAWESIRMMTHTALLCVLGLATVHTLLRLREQGRTTDYVQLGVWAGLGMLAKYNYALFALALIAAASIVPSYRVRLLDRRTILAFAIALALFAPHGIWLAGHHAETQQYVMKYSRLSYDNATAVRGAFAGLANLGWNLVLAVLAPAVVALCVLPDGFCPGRSHRTPENERFLGWLFLFAIALLVVLVGAGVRGYRAHWFAPFLLLLPVWFFGRLDPARLPTWRLPGYGLTLIVAAVAVLAVRSATLCFDFEAGKYQTRDFLHAEVAARVESAGVQPATIYAADPVCGAYQKLYFPQAEIRCLAYPTRATLGERDEGPVLFLWDSTPFEVTPRRLTEDLTSRYGPAQPTFVVVPPRFFRGNTKRLGYMLFSGTGLASDQARLSR